MSNLRSFCILVIFSFLSQPVFAQATVAERVAAFAQDPELVGAVLSLDVIDVATGNRIAAVNPVTAAIPASTQKLLTTAVALDVLGPDHRFTTRLMAVGEIRDGVLQGDLYLIGGGDPSLGSPYLDGVLGLEAILGRWTEAVRTAGITRVNGRVVGDASYFATDGAAPGWPWSDIGNYYGAGAFGLNIHENFYFLDFLQRNREGATPPIQKTRPTVPGLHLTNELRSGPRGSGDQAYIYGAPFNFENYVRGTIPVGSGRFTIKGALPDPPLFAAQALCRRLEAAGIPVALAAETDRSLGGGRFRPGKTLDVYESPPLATLVDRTNLRSNNLYAEALLREINKARGAEPHALSSTAVITEWLSERGLPITAVRLEDGSGLATRNFFPAMTMTSFLRTQADNARWRRSIPVAGRTGSMRGFLRGTAAEGRLAAKSGSVGGVRAYAGYATRADGTELAFALMVNNFTIESKDVRSKLHTLMVQLCSAPLR